MLPISAGAVMLAGPIAATAVGYVLAEGRAGVLLRMAVTDGVAAWVVGLPLLALTGVIGLGFGHVASGLADLPFLTTAVWGTRSVREVELVLVSLMAVAAASVPAWLITEALGRGVVALVAGGQRARRSTSVSCSRVGGRWSRMLCS